MIAARQRKWLIPVALGILFFCVAPALSQLDYSFMPKGGKTLLLEVLGSPPDQQELRKIVEARRSEAEWRDAMSPRGKALSERELRTLAAYLAVLWNAGYFRKKLPTRRPVFSFEVKPMAGESAACTYARPTFFSAAVAGRLNAARYNRSTSRRGS